MLDLAEFETQCIEQRKINLKYLDLFREELEHAGLSGKTIQRHLSNMEFYLNTYLLHDEILPMEEGCKPERLDEYFNWFFIRKCAWSTPASIKTTASSLKKFYKCMREKGYISEDAYSCLPDTFRYDMEDWQKDCAVYNKTGRFPWLDI